MAEFELIADGLRFPEAPVVMDDGSVIVVEIEAKRITRCWPGGKKDVIATPGGGPNGLAIGPGGKLYCCNNGGFEYVESNGYLAPHGIDSGHGLAQRMAGREVEGQRRRRELAQMMDRQRRRLLDDFGDGADRRRLHEVLHEAVGFHHTGPRWRVVGLGQACGEQRRHHQQLFNHGRTPASRRC